MLKIVKISENNNKKSFVELEKKIVQINTILKTFLFMKEIGYFNKMNTF
jgi:hypothetical protein